MSGYIYLYTNRVNAKVYVGQTWNTDARNKQHQKSARYTKKLWNHPFYNAIRKYGWDVFDHQVIAEADTQNALDALECLWIVILRAQDRLFGYNLRTGGSRGRHSTESRVKMIAAQKRKDPPSEETRRRLGDASRGRKRSAETRKKMRQARDEETNCLGCVFGDLTVLRPMPADKNRKRMWECRCSCGRICIVSGGYLRRKGPAKNCGCVRRRGGPSLKFPAATRGPKRKSKRCPVCGTIDISAFGSNAARYDGLQAQCRVCSRK